MTTIHIQEATLNQAEQILPVIVAAFEEYRDRFDPPSGVFKETPESIRQKLGKGGGFIACDDQRMVGAVLYESRPDYMYLGRLAVLPEYRGQQIATRLCASVEEAALQHHFSCLQLGVRIELTGNQQFFQGLGYRIKEYRCHENYTEYTYVWMEKTLAQ